MKTFLKLLLFLFPTLLLSSNSGNDFSDGRISFKTVNKIPIVQGSINGKKAFFIIDSGASMSCLDDSQIDDYQFTATDGSLSAAGYGGTISFNDVQNAKVCIGISPVNIKLRSQDLTVIRVIIEEDTGVIIAGIIGCDYLKENKIIIDFGKNELRKQP